ncbi:MAG TPA: TrkA family potassium uptake protein [Armatimonadota bacterium]|nr:TrkA family potassium uptake protein [Armatimonadota bacterium]
MYVIVVGGGKVGYYLTRTLISEGHEVTLIEQRRPRVARLTAEYGEAVVVGDGCEVRVMEDAGMARADCVVAVTGHDEDNLIICQMAQRYFGVPRQIARVNNPENEDIFHLLGVDETVASTRIIYSLIDQEVETGASLLLTALKRGNIVIVSVDLTAESPAGGKMVKDIHLPGECVLAAIIRQEHILLPSGTTVLEPNDTVIAVADPDSQHALRDALVGAPAPGPRRNSQ